MTSPAAPARPAAAATPATPGRMTACRVPRAAGNERVAFKPERQAGLRAMAAWPGGRLAPT